jgi:hypothetical protein
MPFESVPQVFSFGDPLESGFTAKQLRGRHVTRLRYGRYADTRTVDEWHRLAAAVAGTPEGSALCDLTALALWSLPKPWSRRDDDRVHVCIPAPHRASRRQGVVMHQRVLTRGDVVTRSDLPRTSLARTYVDLAATVKLEELVAIGDAILRSRRCSLQRLSERVHAAAGKRGYAMAYAALPMLDGRAQSSPESLLRMRAVAARLPRPEPQCLVTSVHGKEIAHLDLDYKKYKVGLEHEGRHHTEPRQFAIDTERYSAISAAGWLILRSSAADLAGDSRRILDKLRTARILHGWDGESST